MSERRGGLLWPLVLIAVGVLFLLANFGWLPANWWREAWRLWPLILIFVGLEIVLGRGHPFVGLVIGVLFLAAVLGVAWFSRPSAGQQWLYAQTIREELAGIEEAEVDIQFGMGTLSVSAPVGLSDDLVEGDLSAGGEVSLLRRDRRGTLQLKTPSDRFLERNDWRLLLSPRPLMDLTLRAGAADINLDLRGLAVRRLRLELGATSTTVRLPSAGSLVAAIDAGASSLEIEVPPGVAARIRSSVGLAALTVDESRFPRSGGEFVSPDYGAASHRVELTLRGGVSGITVR